MRTLLVAFIGGIIGTVFASVMALAWTGPTSAPPSGNVSAPINVGTTDQIKNAGLGINSLAVFGNAILNGASRYLNFGTTAGSSGYGIRDNAGEMEFKNSGGSWSSITSMITSSIQNFFSSGSSNTVGQIKFADGTTQTTAAAGVTQEATTFCTVTSSSVFTRISCTTTCPSGYVRSACLGPVTSTPPGGCTCAVNGSSAICRAYCVK